MLVCLRESMSHHKLEFISRDVLFVFNIVRKKISVLCVILVPRFMLKALKKSVGSICYLFKHSCAEYGSQYQWKLATKCSLLFTHFLKMQDVQGRVLVRSHCELHLS